MSTTGGQFVARPLLDRLADRFDLDGECWIMRGRPENNRGYAKVSLGQFNGRPSFRMAHVAAYELLVGPIPAGLELDHLCGRGMCINPDHLEPVTHRENVLRSDNAAAQNARKTHCVNGHELTPENVYSPPKHPNNRNCRTCIRNRNQGESPCR